jgi:hypothetical protein
MKHHVLYLMVIPSMLIITSNCQKDNTKPMGTYGYDKTFFENHDIDFIELIENNDLARLLVVPAYQGRVMTSTAGGDDGMSFGWINHSFIEAGKQDPHFNVYGGEERFWLGPEGGPYSIYFRKGAEQVFDNWLVPPVIDTESFDVVESDSQRVEFVKDAVLANAAGTLFHFRIRRIVSLLSMSSVSALLGVDIPAGLQGVAYQTDNIIQNTGDTAWTKENGLLSIWMLSMFNPTPATTVFIPYQKEGEGVIVNDDYFGKVPSDRLIVENGTIFFKIDGKFRSKIGLPYHRATSLCGSYDSERMVLTLLWCSIPAGPQPYVNSKWGEQEDPYNGDVINSYNDGPVEDGSIMGPFYEIETSSPGAALQPSEILKHTQRIMHFRGDEPALAMLVDQLFDLKLEEIINKFQ